jgi:hypothetical protein
MAGFTSRSGNPVRVTGSDVGTRLEDRVEIFWSTPNAVPTTSHFRIVRNGDLLGVAASTESLFEDRTARPGTRYEYCVFVYGSTVPVGCEFGERAITPPSGFRASQGLHEDQVHLTWVDHSSIESGFNVYRNAGHALVFDGADDFVLAPAFNILGSFSFEFWARRAALNRLSFVLNTEADPEGNPVRTNLEIGFDSDNRFLVGFGTNALKTSEAYTSTGWHHWAVVYDAQTRRRTIYRDAVLVATDNIPSYVAFGGTLEFGRRRRTGNTSGRGFFSGQLDEIRQWSRALTPDEVRTAMTSIVRGNEQALVSYWPMDVKSGLTAPDVTGGRSGQLTNMTSTAWAVSAVPDRHVQLGRNLTTFADRTAVPGYDTYSYRLAAFEDMNRNGIFEPDTDYESDRRNTDGWRALIAPPGDVAAADGQFIDRVRVTWTDRSASEEGFRIYRRASSQPEGSASLIGTIAANGTTFDDVAAASMIDYTYCVTSFAGGNESVKVCDSGRAGGLGAPGVVAATNAEFDDRIRITWTVDNGGRDGFEVFRDGGSAPIATLSAAAREYIDRSAIPNREYQYCVRAFSKADPLNPSFSASTCAEGAGVRAAVLKPLSMTASQGNFEDRVELRWGNPSTSAMFFLLYREDELIEILDHRRTFGVDFRVPSDTEAEYCVQAATVVSGNVEASKSMVSQILVDLRARDAVRESAGLEPSTAEARVEAVYAALGLETSPGKASKSALDAGYVESEPECGSGFRSLHAATGLTATRDEHESHVRLEWQDNSLVEEGYRIYRAKGSSAGETVATLSPDRTTYADYTGVSGQTYVYSVKAFDANGVSTSISREGQRTLKPPTQFTASKGTSETAVRLTWRDNSSAEDGYLIIRRPQGQSGVRDTVGIAGKNETAFDDVVPTEYRGVRFDYWVSAFDKYGASLEAAASGYTFLEGPADVNASDSYADRVVVAWVNHSSVATNYVLTRRPVGADSPDRTETLGSGITSFVDMAVDAGMYEYCVSARLNSNGVNVQSTPVCDVGSRMGTSSTGPTGATAMKVGDGVKGFGRSVAMDNPDILIGSPDDGRGRFHMYRLTAENLLTYHSFLHHGSAPWEKYGTAIAKNGEYVISGDPMPGNANRGYFSIHKRSATAPYVQFHQNDGRPSSLGTSVAIQDSFAVAGDPTRVDSFAVLGDVIICNAQRALRESNSCGAAPPRLANLVPAEWRGGSFGSAVAITRAGNLLYVLVGAPDRDYAFLFSCDVTQGCHLRDKWSYVTRFASPTTGERFGTAVAIGPNIAVVGAPNAKAVVLYERSGTEWEAKYRFTANTEATSFGSAVAVRGNRIIVGAPEEGNQRAGAAYAMTWETGDQSFADIVRYDSRVVEPHTARERFGTSVAIGENHYLVGAPQRQILGGLAERGGAYLIPFGLASPSQTNPPSDVTLTAAEDVRATDGTAPDRIQVRWTRKSQGEDGHIVYRSDSRGRLERIGETLGSVNSYDDFQAAPGDAYTYCVAAYHGRFEGDKSCDVGWRPANGTIAGRVFSSGGAGTESANVCLVPSPNRGMLFDGTGGYVEAAVGNEFKESTRFTLEAWIRAHTLGESRYVLSKEGAYALSLRDGNVRLTLFRNDGNETFETSSSPVRAGTWHHVAAAMGGNDSVFVLVDGVVAFRAQAQRAPNSEGDKLTIGQRGNGTGFFHGQIDEVRVWKVARSHAAIAERRFDPLRGNEESLIGYWPLDQHRARIAPDLTRSANHAVLLGGVYPADSGAPISVCGVTGRDGNFSISRLRYGETTKFEVVPYREGRAFSPRFKEITLSTDSPVQNEVFFNDVTAYTVAGITAYRETVGTSTFTCPVPSVAIHVDKGSLAANDNLRVVSEADGSYTVSVDPSVDPTDTWFVIPRGPTTASVPHTFAPVNRELEVTKDTFRVDFFSNKRSVLTGHFTGGDPGTCGKNIGTATIRIYTQDGCYNREFEVNSGINNGRYPELNLPPLEYLMEVVSIVPPSGASSEFMAEVEGFFKRLGAVEVDLRDGDVQRNLTYRAPIELRIAGLEPSCAGGFSVRNSEGGLLRSLPPVAVIEEYGSADLTFHVQERYGHNQTCDVGEGIVTIFDAIADRVDVDSTMTLERGVVNYTTFGASPNVFAGARIYGVDRSFQKPITVVAQVEGRPALMATEWAIVEGFRERAATFVSATTEEFPLMILHDPPGSGSSAFIEKGSKWCSSISNLKTLSYGAGIALDIAIGFKGAVGWSFGMHTEGTIGAGLAIETKTMLGRSETTLDRARGGNIEICATTTEKWSTSADPGWVGEDIVMGLALNLIFALADKLETQQCEVQLSEILATDLDTAEPFATAYTYGRSHIDLTLIPQLENLVELAGDATLTGQLNGEAAQVRLLESIANWKSHLALIDQNKKDGVRMKNHSFSGGVEVSVSESADTTRVTRVQNTKVALTSENRIGLIFTAGYDQKIQGAIDIGHEWVRESSDTEATTLGIGYTLSDEDGGDFFSVDIGKDPMFGTFVFNTVAGRSSNPCETNTQCRDNPMILVNPPVRYNVHPAQAAPFQLTLINASESKERRRYVLAVPPEKNPNNLAIHVAGGPLISTREYLLEPGMALTVNLDAYASPSASSYERVGVMLYPPDEWPIWAGDPRSAFERSDTAFFSVYFTDGVLLTATMSEGWNWFSINSEGGEIDEVLGGLSITDGDILKSQHAQSRYDSTTGWTGALSRLLPGPGYRIRLSNPTLLRVPGEPVEVTEPLDLQPGWTWIGYLPTRSMSVDEAMVSLKDRVLEGDVIVGQRSFAQYVKGIGWIGTLQDMMPGEAYAIHLGGGGKLLYPNAPENAAPRPPEVREVTTRGPDWAIEAEKYDASMTVVAEVQLYSSPVLRTAMKVAAFDNDEIRGVGEVRYVKALKRYLAFMMLYGDMDEQKPLVVHVYDGETDQLYSSVATVTFGAQTMLGQPAEPVILELSNAGLAPELLDLPETFALHQNFPNPFNDYTIIGYDVPEASHVKMVVYDLLGRRIAVLHDGQQKGGRHRLVFDAHSVASGVYFYRMEIDKTIYTGKMVVVK